MEWNGENMLDIQLQIFKRVVEKESFSAAAQELHMTQSAVSQQIHNLEFFYGVKLFDRLHRRIVLTDAGAALYPYALELERLYQKADETMHRLMDVVEGQLGISSSLSIGEYLLPELLVQFKCLYPLVKISMNIENTEKVIADVLEGSTHVGFIEGVYEPQAALVHSRFAGDRLVIIASPDHPHYRSGPVSLTTLLAEPWVLREPDSGTRRIFEQFVSSHHLDVAELNVVMELSSTEAIKRAVKAGLGLGVMTYLAVEEAVSRGELTVISLEEGTIDRDFIMLYHKAKFQTRAAGKFCAFIQEYSLLEQSILP
jgi:DNA-binding transcriptional LysR family regulator